MKSTTALVKQQTVSLKILANKNILNQSLIKTNFDTFSQLKDKQSVKEVLPEFIKVCAYLGCTTGYDIRLLVKIFRRIFKTPEEIGDQNPDIILDLLTILALNQFNYKEYFDEKSSLFIDNCLDFVETKFIGFHNLELKLEDNQNQNENSSKKGKKQILNYFQGIKSEKKLFNKVMVIKQPYDNDKEEVFYKRPLNSFSGKNQILQLDEDEKVTQKYDHYDILQQEIQNQEEKVDFVIVDQLEQIVNLSVQKDMELNDESLEIAMEDKEKYQDGLKVKSYDVKAKENQYSRFNEELDYLNSRKMKLNQMDRKQKHLFLFTNFESLNFVNINKNNQVKAWAVLYHFRSKSLDSHIFEEFSSIVMRNCKNKIEGHELFNQFYKDLITYSFKQKQSSKVDIRQNCQISGWPIDVQIRTKKYYNNNSSEKDQMIDAIVNQNESEDLSDDDDIVEIKNNKLDQSKSIYNMYLSQEQNDKKAININLQFFLQEEMCLNIGQNQEQPLGMQQLMLRHLKNAAGSRIHDQLVPQVKYVSEKDLKECLKDKDTSQESTQTNSQSHNEKSNHDSPKIYLFQNILQNLWS